HSLRPCRYILSFPTRRSSDLFIIIFCSIYGFFVILTWLPYYLETARGISGTSVAFVSSLVPWASIPGMLLFGWISDKIGKQRPRSEEHTSELQSRFDLVCRLL